MFRDLHLVEQGNERLVGRRDKHQLQRVTVEGDPLERRHDRREHHTTGNYKEISDKCTLQVL